MKTALLAILLFCIMIFPHELGHFIAAKKCGVQVNEFAFGMGPVLWKKQRGETLHTIRLFPLGGFCAMEGEDGGIEEDGISEYNPRAFHNKKPWQKLIILAAGSFMNVVCAFLVMSIVVCVLGFHTTTIGGVEKDSPAALAGLMEKDRIIEIDGQTIESWNQVGTVIQEAGGNDLKFVIERKGTGRMEFTVRPVLDPEGERYLAGIFCKVSHDPWKSVVSGFRSTGSMFGIMFESLRMLGSGEVGVSDLSGPVGIVQMVNETSEYGLWYYGFLTALICVNLAVVNMLPLPALDGGRIIFVLYSWITGRKVSAKVEGIVHAAGLTLLLGLMIYVTIHDVGRILG